MTTSLAQQNPKLELILVQGQQIHPSLDNHQMETPYLAKQTPQHPPYPIYYQLMSSRWPNWHHWHHHHCQNTKYPLLRHPALALHHGPFYLQTLSKTTGMRDANLEEDLKHFLLHEYIYYFFPYLLYPALSSPLSLHSPPHTPLLLLFPVLLCEGTHRNKLCLFLIFRGGTCGCATPDTRYLRPSSHILYLDRCSHLLFLTRSTNTLAFPPFEDPRPSHCCKQQWTVMEGVGSGLVVVVKAAVQ